MFLWTDDGVHWNVCENWRVWETHCWVLAVLHIKKFYFRSSSLFIIVVRISIIFMCSLTCAQRSSRSRAACASDSALDQTDAQPTPCDGKRFFLSCRVFAFKLQTLCVKVPTTLPDLLLMLNGNYHDFAHAVHYAEPRSSRRGPATAPLRGGVLRDAFLPAPRLVLELLGG